MLSSHQTQIAYFLELTTRRINMLTCSSCGPVELDGRACQGLYPEKMESGRQQCET